jgi:DNA-binding NarL/FixJ family response regulator
LAALISTLDTVQLVGAVGMTEGAVSSVIASQPAVVIVDLPPSTDGAFALVREIVGTPGGPRVVGLRRQYARELVAGAFDAGVSACVSTEAAVSDLLDAIEAARVGRTYLCPFVARVLIEGPSASQTAAPVGRQLTQREQEVLALIASGNTDRQISGMLGLAVGTVHTHRKHMMAKLGVRNVTSLLRRAREAGLLPAP